MIDCGCKHEASATCSVSSTNVRASFSCVFCIRTMSALRLKDHANSFCDATSHPIRFEKRWVHGHSEGVYWSHSEPRSQALLRLSHYCGTRSTGKEVTVPLSFHLGILDPKRALKAGSPSETGLFCDSMEKAPCFRTRNQDGGWTHAN